MTTADPLPIFDDRLCPDCGLRPHGTTCWRCDQCQRIHDLELTERAERRAPRPIELP